MNSISCVSSKSLISEISCQGLQLNRQQMLALPKSAQKAVQGALAQLCADLRVQYLISREGAGRSVCLHIDGGNLYFTAAGRTRRLTPALRVLDFPKFLKTMGKVRDVARVYLPEAFGKQTRIAYEVIEKRPAPDTGLFGVEATAVFNDVNSFLRHSLTIAGRGTQVIRASALAGAGLNVFASVDGIRKNTLAGRAAQKCADKEGLVQTGVLGTASVSGLLGSIAALASYPGADQCGAISSTMFLGSSLYAMHYLHSFQNDFRAIMTRQEIPLQKKVESGILFLRQQIALTESDLRELALQYPSREKRGLAKEKKLQEKWARFVRRVGQECADKVALDSGRLLEEVRSGKCDEALAFLNEVDHQVSVKIVMQRVLFVIASIGILASCLLACSHLLFSAPLLLLILSSMSAVSALLGLFLDSPIVRARFV